MSVFPWLFVIDKSSLLSEPALAAGEATPPLSSPEWPGLVQRLAFLAAIFILEVLAFSIWLDTGTLGRISGLTGLVGDWAKLRHHSPRPSGPDWCSVLHFWRRFLSWRSSPSEMPD